MPRAPHADDPTGSTDAAPSWAADMVEAGSASPPSTGATAQMPLFPAAAAPAPARARHARLRAALRSLLGLRAHRPPPAASSPTTQPTSSWPDSFFDAGAGHEP